MIIICYYDYIITIRFVNYLCSKRKVFVPLKLLNTGQNVVCVAFRTRNLDDTQKDVSTNTTSGKPQYLYGLFLTRFDAKDDGNDVL